MKAWLMDVYRSRNSLVLWLKTPNDIRLKLKYAAFIYIESRPDVEQFLIKKRLKYALVKKPNFLNKKLSVFKVKVPYLSLFEAFVREIEQHFNYDLQMYNADIKPEQMFLNEHNLRPFQAVVIKGNSIIGIDTDESIPLKKLEITIPSTKTPITKLTVDNQKLEGEESTVLKAFVEHFNAKDPDVIIMQFAYSRLPLLVQRLKHYNLSCSFNRWDSKPIKY
ncbi:MAG: hypothetical protein ABIG95_01845, partial [Candidatus Woesearchaeota archaeon]